MSNRDSMALILCYRKGVEISVRSDEMSGGRRTVYEETFDDGPGGWCGWKQHGDNVLLELHNGVLTSRSPWGVDSHHAPPGGGYLSLIAFLYTASPGPAFAGPNRFFDDGYSRDLTNAKLTVRMRGDVRQRGAEVVLLVQAGAGDILANFILTGQSFLVTPDWSQQSVVLAPDPGQWICIRARHDMKARYGYGDIVEALKDVDNDIILVWYPLTVVPLEPTDDIHRRRPVHDYAIDRRYLPEGELQIDTIRIEYPSASSCPWLRKSMPAEG